MILMQIEIILLAALGYLLTKKGMISTLTRKEITDLVIYIILPCNIFHSFEIDVSMKLLWECGIVFVIAFSVQLFYKVLNRFLYSRFTPERQVVMKYATISNNAGFMGLPVIETVYGSTGLLYGSIVLIPIRIFMWTSGLSLFTQVETREKIKILATHPCIWAVILGFIYMFLPFRLPAFINNAIIAIGNCTTALTMIVVGSILSEVDIKSVLEKGCFYYSVIRLIAIPGVVFIALLLIGIDPVVTGVIVLSTGMPAATLTPMLAHKYGGGDAGFASKLIFVSTVLSLITLPLFAAIIK